MVRLRPAAAVVTVLALAAPVSALAQSGASDNQYADPFANTPAGAGHKAPSQHPSSAAPSTTAPTAGAPAPATSAPAASGAPAASSAPVASSASSNLTAPYGASGSSAGAGTPDTNGSLHALPFTGFDTLDETIAGAGLLLAGAALRLRLRRRDACRSTHEPAGL